MAVSEVPDPEIRILGRPSVAFDQWADLPPKLGDLLVVLALSPQGRGSKWLQRNLWPGGDPEDTRNVATHIAQLKNYGVKLPKGVKGAPYRLDHADEVIDCRRFVQGVGALPAQPEPAAIDDLLGLWRGNPWERDTNVPPAAWAAVVKGLETLIGLIAALGDSAAALHNLGEFEQQMAGDPLMDRLRRPVARRPGKSVLIVDDQIGHGLADVLGGYTTDVIVSLKDYWDRRQSDGPFRHDCALVDLHLERSMTDRAGLTVVRDLKQQRPNLPIAVLSAGLPPLRDQQSLCREYGVEKVLHKSNRKGDDFGPLIDVVRSLISS